MEALAEAQTVAKDKEPEEDAAAVRRLFVKGCQ
jgi:hypothetical protein